MTRADAWKVALSSLSIIATLVAGTIVWTVQQRPSLEAQWILRGSRMLAEEVWRK